MDNSFDRSPVDAGNAGTAAPAFPPPPIPIVPLGAGGRIGAYLIDCIPIVIIAIAVAWIPVIGAMFAGVIGVCYWLLRDIGGGSIGKKLVGARVASLGGGDAPVSARILRNLPLIIAPALLVIPLLGLAIGPTAAGVITIIEAVFVLVKGRRMGDMLAGTVVVKA